MFEEMIESIKIDTVKYLFHVQMERAPERERVVQKTTETHGSNNEEPKKKEPIRKEISVGRNEKCPCGSGKKFKNCCGREV